MKILTIALVLFAAGVAESADAQSAARTCTYDQCALALMPRLTSLDVVRGSDERRVASLGFLLPTPVTHAFDGSAEARPHADRAFALRRVGAVLTDVGGAVLATGIIRAAATSDHRRVSLGIAFGGAALFVASVPIHFAADAELSRAVHAYNRLFAQ